MDEPIEHPALQHPAHQHPAHQHAVHHIDCAACVMEGSDVCDDCVVTFIVRREPGDAVIVDAEEVRGLRVLARGGLVPPLRHRTRAG